MNHEIQIRKLKQDKVILAGGMICLMVVIIYMMIQFINAAYLIDFWKYNATTGEIMNESNY